MAEEKFNIKEAISYGWNTFKENLTLLVGLVAIQFVISGLPRWVVNLDGNATATPVSLVVNILNMILQIGIITITLKILAKKKTGFGDLFENINVFWNYLLATILYALIVIAGFILLIIPGFIWAIKYQFYGYFVIDKKMGAVEALKQSAAITEGERWNLFKFGLWQLGIIILGALALGVGLFFAIPVVWLSVVFVYKKLSSAKG